MNRDDTIVNQQYLRHTEVITKPTAPGLAGYLQDTRTMSKNQRLVIAALALAVAIVLGCFGGYLLTYVAGGSTYQTLAPVQATETPTEYPTDTPTVVPSPTADKVHVDFEYEVCAKAVLCSWKAITDYILTSAKTSGAGSWCQDQPDYYSLATGLESYHFSCPDPQYGPWLEVQRNLDLAVGYQVLAIMALGSYCAEDGTNPYWMLQALDHLEEATPYAEQADKLLHRY